MSEKNSVQGGSPVRLMALDLRGTVVETPRSGNLERSLLSLGVERVLAAEVETVLPELVRTRYVAEEQVLNWTLVTVLAAREHLFAAGVELTPVDCDAIMGQIEVEYLADSKPLVSDHDLHAFVQRAKAAGVETVFIPDGPSWRERELLRRLFPQTMASGCGVFGADTAGSNKLGARFYLALARHFDLSPSSVLVVGDRLDKDVKFGLEAGCQCTYIGPTLEAVPKGVAQFLTFNDFVNSEPNTEERQ